MKDFKAAIFDLDGTLMDSMWFWKEIDNIFLKERGISPVPEDYMHAIAHLGVYETALYTIDRFGFKETPEELIKVWSDMAIDFYENEVTLKKGAYEYLNALKSKGIKLAVATANDEYLYLPALKKTGIYDMFDVIVNVGEVERKKGFPDIYLLACERMGTAVSETLVFEDIYIAVCGACDGGFRTVGVFDKTSEGDAERIKKKADKFIYDFDELER